MSKSKSEVPYGTLDLLILKTLETMGAIHGYRIARRIEQVAGNLLRLNQGSISRSHATGTTRLDSHRVGNLGDQAQGQVLFADQGRIEATPYRDCELGAQEDQPGSAPVVVLSYALWQTRFGGDPDILNRDLVLDGEPHRIIGVLPAGSFDRDILGEIVDYWKPLVFAPDQITRQNHWLSVVGRLRAGVSPEQARAKMRALAEVMPKWKKDWTFAIDPFGRQLVGDNLRRSIYLVFGAVLMAA